MNYKRNGQNKPSWNLPSFLRLCLHPICYLCTISVKAGRKSGKKIYGRSVSHCFHLLGKMGIEVGEGRWNDLLLEAICYTHFWFLDFPVVSLAYKPPPGHSIFKNADSSMEMACSHLTCQSWQDPYGQSSWVGSLYPWWETSPTVHWRWARTVIRRPHAQLHCSLLFNVGIRPLRWLCLSFSDIFAQMYQSVSTTYRSLGH